MTRAITVATTQYTIGDDLADNLQRILDYIDEAADRGADLVVFPEFANHHSFYANAEHCWSVAVTEDGAWIGAIRAKARARAIWVAVNASTRGDTPPTVYDQNYLIDRQGAIVGTVRKQVFIGSENVYMARAYDEATVFATELGRIGFATCMDGVLPETPRNVALRGAQIIINSLNSIARDEPELHIPTRAAENRCWVVSSCKAGPLLPEALFDLVTSRVEMPRHALYAPGQSRIVDPFGNVVVSGGHNCADLVLATIDPTLADDKTVPDAGDLFADRRPDTYGLLVQPNDALPLVATPSSVEVAPYLGAAIQHPVLATPAATLTRAMDLIEQAADLGARLAVLPELFAYAPGVVAANPAAAADASRVIDYRLAALAKARDLYLVAGIVDEAHGRFSAAARLWGPTGALATYRQVHLRAADRVWATPGDQFVTVDTPIGRIGLMLGHDGLMLETARILALQGADLIAYPTTWTTDWEPRLAMLERAAENHLTILAAARLDSPVPYGSSIAYVGRFPSPLRGILNPSFRVDALPRQESVLTARIDPVASRNKRMMPLTDAVLNRRAELYRPLVEPASRLPTTA